MIFKNFNDKAVLKVCILSLYWFRVRTSRQFSYQLTYCDSLLNAKFNEMNDVQRTLLFRCAARYYEFLLLCIYCYWFLSTKCDVEIDLIVLYTFSFYERLKIQSHFSSEFQWQKPTCRKSVASLHLEKTQIQPIVFKSITT